MEKNSMVPLNLTYLHSLFEHHSPQRMSEILLYLYKELKQIKLIIYTTIMYNMTLRQTESKIVQTDIRTSHCLQQCGCDCIPISLQI